MAATATLDKSAERDAYERGRKAGKAETKETKKGLVDEMLDDFLSAIELATTAAAEKKKKLIDAKKEGSERALQPQDRYNIMMLSSGSAHDSADFLTRRHAEIGAAYRKAKEEGDAKAELLALGDADSLYFSFTKISTQRSEAIILDIYDSANELYTRMYGVSLPSNPELPADRGNLAPTA